MTDPPVRPTPDPQTQRRWTWIAWSLRPQIRPSVLAGIVRARGGEPPEIPSRQGTIPAGHSLRPSEERFFWAAKPGGEEAVRAEERAHSLGCRIETPEDDGWVARFWTEMVDPPVALYIRGELHAPDQPAVAIVGTRHASENGLALARSLARDLAVEGVTIVSGLALGIDGSAHRGALDVQGRTIAVLGGGVDRPGPPIHAALGARVARSGALVSEFPLGCEPMPLHFPRRNRILAALAQVVVVVEGGKRSGARSTVDHALAMGREVAAVPRDPVHEGSTFPNGLLRSGATPVTSAGDVMDLLRASFPETARSLGAAADPLDRVTLGRIESGERTLALLMRDTDRTGAEVLASLGRLELAGRIRRLPGMCFEAAESGS